MSFVMQLLAGLFALLGMFALIPAIIAFSVFLNGWVFWYLWAWFAVPIFHLPPLNLVQCMGTSLVVGFLTKQQRQAVQDEKLDHNVNFVVGVIGPLTILALGYIIKSYM